MKPRAPLNRTLVLSDSEKKDLSNQLTILKKKSTISEVKSKIINQDLFEVIDLLPDSFIDLLFIDPPYNLNKKFAAQTFKKMQTDKYEDWLDSWLLKLIPRLKKNASIYFCCDWKTSNSAYNVLRKYFIVRNRITWEREKGRGSKDNWKNSYEDIWYCTVTDIFTFNLNAVKLKRLVRAPYKNDKGTPKDWKSENGKNYRITHPSNLWTDITIPFWSMPENTDHPTQKPEKLLAKIILASSNEGDIIFDPFAGSGTALVTAKKLDRSYCGVEIDKEFALLTVKRLSMAEKDKSIQGYHDGVFWERNTLGEQKKSSKG